MILVDTHVLVWFMQGDSKLGITARQIITEEADRSEVVVPAIVMWEVGLMASRGSVDLGDDPRAWLKKVFRAPGFALAPLEIEIAVETASSPWSHKDPADRMIVATARHWGAPLLTADRHILDYAAAGHLQAIDARR